jgi:hypothetical protein
VDHCGLGERACEADTCSEGGVCPTLQLAEPEPVVNTPPSLHLVGSAVVQVAQHSTFAACTAATPTSVVCDRGATAADHQDGDLTARVTACGARWVSRGVGACLVNTSLPGRYNVTYAVADSGGLHAAAAHRTVEVTPTCSGGEKLCADEVSCSAEGVCEGDLGLDAQLEHVAAERTPTLTLRTAPALGRYYSDEEVANREIRVWHGATEKGP